jgi:hypothetical protein
VSDIAQALDIAKLRCLARLAAWEKVVSDTAGDHDFSADGASFSRSQINEMARQQVAAKTTDAAQYLEGFQAVRQRVRPVHDPYQYRPDEERPL